MDTVTVSRRIDAALDDVRAAMNDRAAFTRAAGFDEVDVADDRVAVANHVGFLEIELTLEVTECTDSSVTYVQRDGIFREMRTEYTVAPEEDGVTVTATTEFELAAPFVGPLFDGTVVKRQRRRELEAQLDYLADATR